MNAPVSSYAARYAPRRRYCDADSHIMETFEWLGSYADPALRERLPAMALGGAGKMAAKAIALASARRSDAQATAELEKDVIASAKGWGAYGATDREERRQALDHLGFSRQLVFSTFAGTQFLRGEDLALKYGGARAHNRGMAEFCKGDPRLMAVASLPLDDPEQAIAEFERARADGCGAFWIAAAPAGAMSPGHPALDPLWARLQEAKLPFVLHIGQGTRVLPKAYENNGRERGTDWLGGGENLRVLDYMVLPHAPEIFLSAMVFHGVFERFPNLKGGVIELGGGWVPAFLTRLDMAAKFFMKTDAQLKELTLKPSEYIRRQVAFTPFPGEDVGALIRQAGPELFLFSSDFPHPEGSKDPIGKFEAVLKDFSEDVKTAFYSGNFERVFGT
ncbi:MAG TPA: amidohydrolase family protein [Rhizomicrobium sp.]|nr:amidohydrolase family protein [Rhizomicrobium sp.]